MQCAVWATVEMTKVHYAVWIEQCGLAIVEVTECGLAIVEDTVYRAGECNMAQCGPVSTAVLSSVVQCTAVWSSVDWTVWSSVD